MTFLKCSISGNKYGEATDDDKEIVQQVASGTENLVPRSLSTTGSSVSNFVGCDSTVDSCALIATKN